MKDSYLKKLIQWNCQDVRELVPEIRNILRETDDDANAQAAMEEVNAALDIARAKSPKPLPEWPDDLSNAFHFIAQDSSSRYFAVSLPLRHDSELLCGTFEDLVKVEQEND